MCIRGGPGVKKREAGGRHFLPSALGLNKPTCKSPFSMRTQDLVYGLGEGMYLDIIVKTVAAVGNYVWLGAQARAARGAPFFLARFPSSQTKCGGPRFVGYGSHPWLLPGGRGRPASASHRALKPLTPLPPASSPASAPHPETPPRLSPSYSSLGWCGASSRGSLSRLCSRAEKKSLPCPAWCGSGERGLGEGEGARRGEVCSKPTALLGWETKGSPRAPNRGPRNR